VSEVGFMMEDEKLQLIIGLFGELMKDINDVKTDINNVKEELRNDMKSKISAVRNDIENSISTVKGNVSALETKINTGQEELRQEIVSFKRG
jgi:archaellum component FlaC